MGIGGIGFLMVVVILPHLIPFAAVFFYEIKIAVYRKLWLSLLPLIVFIPVTMYGYLRKTGKIIYATDNPAGFLWSTWYINGSIILRMGYSALFGLLLYFMYRFIKNATQRWK